MENSQDATRSLKGSKFRVHKEPLIGFELVQEQMKMTRDHQLQSTLYLPSTSMQTYTSTGESES